MPSKQINDVRCTTVNVDDNVSVGGDLAVTGDATVTGDLTVSGAIPGQVVALSYNFGAGSVDDTVFVSAGAWALVSASASYTTAEGLALTAQLNKCTGTQAPSAGTNMLQATFDINAAVNTVQNGTLSATAADYTLAAGDRICVDYSAAITTAAGGCISLVLEKL